MCVEYVPLRTNQRRLFRPPFALPVPAVEFKPSVFPLDSAPLIKRDPRTGQFDCIAATFGLIPYWSKDRVIGRKTYNARTETVAEKPAYRTAWRQRQFAIAPMAGFYEPNWETGRAVRWRIEVAGEETLGVAAIWDRWTTGDGREEISFSLLTMNAAAHPLMRRFHGPDDEKRMLVVLHPVHFEAWLSADVASAVNLIQPFPAELMHAYPEPREPRPKQASSAPPAAPAAAPVQGELL